MSDERTRCANRVGMTRAAAMAFVARARGYGVRFKAVKCRGCAAYHVWPKPASES